VFQTHCKVVLCQTFFFEILVFLKNPQFQYWFAAGEHHECSIYLVLREERYCPVIGPFGEFDDKHDELCLMNCVLPILQRKVDLIETIVCVLLQHPLKLQEIHVHSEDTSECVTVRTGDLQRLENLRLTRILFLSGGALVYTFYGASICIAFSCTWIKCSVCFVNVFVLVRCFFYWR